MTRLDDLTILLTMVDKTGKAFKSVDKKMARLQKITKAMKVMAINTTAAAATVGSVFSRMPFHMRRGRV